MIREILDNNTFRVCFAIFVGIPATLAFLVAFAYGIIFGFIAVEQRDWLSTAFGSATLLGTLGVAGAWLRLAKRSRDLSRARTRFIRVGLACGMAACLILLGVVLWAEGPATLGALPGGLFAAAVIFYAGT